MNTPYIPELSRVIEHSIEIINAHTGIETTAEGEIAQNFLVKNTICALSINNLIFPKPIKIRTLSPNPLTLYDMPSAYVLARSIFESYINFHFLLFSYKSPEEKKCNLLLWQRHVFTERLKMSEYFNAIAYKKDIDNQNIEAITLKIKKNEHFQNLSKRQQDKLITENKYTLISIPDKAIQAGISEHHTRFLYKLLSNYAHSDPFAIMQFNAVTNSTEAKQLIENLPLSYTEAFLILTINLYSKIYPDVMKYLNEYEFIKEKIDFYTEYLRK